MLCGSLAPLFCGLLLLSRGWYFSVSSHPEEGDEDGFHIHEEGDCVGGTAEDLCGDHHLLADMYHQHEHFEDDLPLAESLPMDDSRQFAHLHYHQYSTSPPGPAPESTPSPPRQRVRKAEHTTIPSHSHPHPHSHSHTHTHHSPDGQGDGEYTHAHRHSHSHKRVIIQNESANRKKLEKEGLTIIPSFSSTQHGSPGSYKVNVRYPLCISRQHCLTKKETETKRGAVTYRTALYC